MYEVSLIYKYTLSGRYHPYLIYIRTIPLIPDNRAVLVVDRYYHDTNDTKGKGIHDEGNKHSHIIPSPYIYYQQN